MIQRVLKNGHRNLFQLFSIFLNILELFEWRRGDLLYMTAGWIKNFVNCIDDIVPFLRMPTTTAVTIQAESWSHFFQDKKKILCDIRTHREIFSKYYYI